MKKILLVNPPVYDFTAYDFWLRPYGLLTVGGYLRSRFDLSLYDFLDRTSGAGEKGGKSDKWGRGHFRKEPAAKPEVFKQVPRRYSRFGKTQDDFASFYHNNGPFDYVLIQTVMTYWYPGVKEVIDTVRAADKQAKIVLGGVYATLCSQHAEALGSDFLLKGPDLNPLWDYLSTGLDNPVFPEPCNLPFWDGYQTQGTGVIKLTDGCPFKCSYCSVPYVYNGFSTRNQSRCRMELEKMISLGIDNIAFYDDALLHRSSDVIVPFLEWVIAEKISVNFHTPNALNARFITADLAELMVQAGVKTFYIGYESDNLSWQNATGAKVYTDEFTSAVDNLIRAGADRKNITAYLILGHPDSDSQQIENSIKRAHNLGIKVMLADYSPVPGSIDSRKSQELIDISEPLNHNKTAFTILTNGSEYIDRVKQLAKKLNRCLS